MDFLDSLKAARVRMTTFFPYYGRVAFALQFVEQPGLGTLAVDKYWRCYYDPELGTKPFGDNKAPLTVDELVGVLAHECNHILRDHMVRLPTGVNPLVWNIAGDAEINDDLGPHLKTYGNGCVLPDGLVYPKDFAPPAPDGLTAEEYLQHLRNNAQEGGDGIPIDMQGKPDCGSASGGPSREYEKPADPSNGEGVSEAQGDLIRRQTAQDVQDYKKSTGTSAGDLDRWSEEMLNPTVDWRKVLSAELRMAVAYSEGDYDYSFRKPNYRSGWEMEPGRDWIRPGTQSPVPEIGVVIDTSGSIGKKDLEAAMGEVKGICETLNGSIPLRVYAVDAAVHSTERVFDAKQVSSLKGGGGTDMGVGIAKAEKDKVNICVVITDGYTPWPTRSPKCRVIVALLPGYSQADAVPHWAKVVEITND
jgi:predicted metal-dependent peptidase